MSTQEGLTDYPPRNAAQSESAGGLHLVKIQDQQAGVRLDRYLAQSFPMHSRSQWRRMIDAGLVLRDNVPLSQSLLLRGGEQLLILEPAPSPSGLAPLDLPLDVLHEDDDIVVIDKPAGLVVHPSKGHQQDTLLNALVARYPQLSGGENQLPSIVHRLDRDTSGLMVIALSERAADSIPGQLKSRTVLKQYLALVHGLPVEPEATIEAPIGRSPGDRTKMAVVVRGRPAVTHYAVLRQAGRYSLLNVRLETGRTHQIRVHLHAIGHPVAGDPVYGGIAGEIGLGRQFLHANHLEFSHPKSGDRVVFRSGLPPDLGDALRIADS